MRTHVASKASSIVLCDWLQTILFVRQTILSFSSSNTFDAADTIDRSPDRSYNLKRQVKIIRC